jgi:hypothetical protein
MSAMDPLTFLAETKETSLKLRSEKNISPYTNHRTKRKKRGHVISREKK